LSGGTRLKIGLVAWSQGWSHGAPVSEAAGQVLFECGAKPGSAAPARAIYHRNAVELLLHSESLDPPAPRRSVQRHEQYLRQVGDLTHVSACGRGQVSAHAASATRFLLIEPDSMTTLGSGLT